MSDIVGSTEIYFLMSYNFNIINSRIKYLWILVISIFIDQVIVFSTNLQYFFIFFIYLKKCTNIGPQVLPSVYTTIQLQYFMAIDTQILKGKKVEKDDLFTINFLTLFVL